MFVECKYKQLSRTDGTCCCLAHARMHLATHSVNTSTIQITHIINVKQLLVT